MRKTILAAIAVAIGCAPATPTTPTTTISANDAAAPFSSAPGSATAPTPVTSATDSATASSPPPSLPAPIAKLHASAASSRAYDIVRSLTDEVGPRSAGSAGDKAAVAWALRAFKEHGFANVHAERVMVRHWQRGAETASIVSPIAQPLHIAALGSSDATPATGLEAEIALVTSMAELEKLDKKSTAGKIVFIDVPTRRARDGAGYGENAGLRYAGAKLAQKAGALALLVRSIGTDANNLPHTGAKSKDEKGIPAAAISGPDAELLHRVVSLGKPVRVKLVLTPKLLPNAESANVVGEIVGRDKPDEAILLGAHLDSWDLGTGAIDDGAGCAIVMDAARMIGALDVKPRRTVRVVLYANEENGREGGDEYAKAHAAEANKIVAAMEADFGADRAYETHYLGAPEHKARFQTLTRLVEPLGIVFADRPAHGGTDVSPLRALGVPMLDLAQDGSRYFDWHHTANDTFDKIDKDQITQAAVAFATIAYAVADMDGDFGRVPEEHRKARW